MPSGKPLILVVDNSNMFLSMMKEFLERYGYRAITAKNGEEALRIFAEFQPAIVLLDIMMYGIDGFTVCRRLREVSDVPIIMVSGSSEATFELDGFKAGADDYIHKPFEPKTLIARIEALLRRTSQPMYPETSRAQTPIFQYQDLRIDFERRIVAVSGQTVDLTLTEYKLLCLLARNAGKIVSSDEILHELCDGHSGINTNLVKVNISRLRRNLGDDDRKPRFIVTRPWLGYMLRGSELIICVPSLIAFALACVNIMVGPIS